MDAEGRAGYGFYLEGSADCRGTDGESARVLPGTAAPHFGSVASWTSPADEHIHAAVQRLRTDGTALISYDPNVRSALLASRGAADRPSSEASASPTSSRRAARTSSGSTPAPQSGGLQRAGWVSVLRWSSSLMVLAVLTPFPRGQSRRGRRVAVVDTVGAGGVGVSADRPASVGACGDE
ncbi:hypothetical protein ABZT04_40685 [Streptomyces sp. NPDC005492]|uniref:hypothetical protein n=1 Tax=Streptomyces sp. NPDC005492 TaxID=3156883 RepID=UPI00339F0DAC